jgi:hypothetical protein
MARLTGGAYIPIGTRARAMERLYTEYIAPKARRHFEATSSEHLVHRYQWLVGMALLLLAVEMLLRERIVKTED